MMVGILMVGLRLDLNLRVSVEGWLLQTPTVSTPSPPIKSLDFRGFDSSRLLILRGGNSHARRI